MPKFSLKSRERLSQCHPDLQMVMNRAIEVIDFSVICGHRNKTNQNAAFHHDPPRSTLKWPKSKHNKKPAMAVDIAPYPLDWDDIGSFYRLAGVVQACANQLGVPIFWGGDFDDIFDGPHFELIE